MKGVVFLFPGQGAQYVGMGKELYERYPIAKEVFMKSSDAVGYDIAKMCFEGPEDELKKTEITQPAILTVSIAVMEVLKSEGIVPAAAAGLSLGEYGALVAAASLEASQAVQLVQKRGRFMQEAVPLGVGTMAAILGLDRDKVEECCDKASEFGVVEPANYNCPGQIVISGHIVAVEKACEYAKALGAKRAMPLQVSAPFHSSLLTVAGEQLFAVLKGTTISDPQTPVISNVTADIVSSKNEIIDLLVRQVSHSVLWEDSMVKMLAMGYDTFIEVGPGKALNGFMKKINKDAAMFNVEDIASLEKTLQAIGEK